MPEITRISFSKAKTWRRCHKQFDYKYNQRLERKRKAAPLLRGSILHEMLDARAKMLMKQKTVTPTSVLKRYEKEFRQLFLEERDQYGDFISDIQRAFDTYCRSYPDDSFEYLGVEEELILDLAPGIQFIGYIDKRIRDKKRKLKYVVDHKTHRNIPDEEARFADLQMVFYVWGHNKKNPKDQVDGIVWDYIRTKPPTIPEQLKSGELSQRANIDTDVYTYKAEIDRLKLDPKPYMEFLKKLGERRNSFVERVFLPSPPKIMIDTAVSDLVSTAEQIRDFGSKLKDRNSSKDCSWCTFYNLCQAEMRGLDSDFIRKADFTVREDENDAKETTEQA